MTAAALAVRFLLELCALAALAYWGITAGGSLIGDIVLGLGAPLAAAVVWGTFVSPRASRPLTGIARLRVELAVFVAACGGLALAGQPLLALLLGIAYAGNRAMLWAAGER